MANPERGGEVFLAWFMLGKVSSMMAFDPHFQWEFRYYTEDDFEAGTWLVEFCEEKSPSLAIIRETIDLSLCEEVHLRKTMDGEFFMFWSTRHPELPTRQETYGSEFSLTDDQEREWLSMLRVLGTREHFTKITRRQAFEIIALHWLPDEFLADAGVDNLNSEE